MDRVALYLTLVGLSALLLGGLGVANATRAYLATKTATVATLKCLGASQRLIFLLYLLLVMALALPAVLMGLAVGAAAPFIADGLMGEVLGWRGAPGPYAAPLALAALFGIYDDVYRKVEGARKSSIRAVSASRMSSQLPPAASA